MRICDDSADVLTAAGRSDYQNETDHRAFLSLAPITAFLQCAARHRIFRWHRMIRSYIKLVLLIEYNST